MSLKTLILRNLTHNKLRTLLLGFVIAVAFFLFAVLTTFNIIMGASVTRSSTDRLIVSSRVGLTQPLPIAHLERVRRVNGIDVAGHQTWYGGYYQDPRNPIAVFATDPDELLALYSELQLSADSVARFSDDRTTMIAGHALAEKQGWSVGDRIPIHSNIFTNAETGKAVWEFTLVGVFFSPDNTGFESNAYIHYSTFNPSRTFAEDTIGTLIVRLAKDTDPEQISRTIDYLFANSLAETLTQSEQAYRRSFVEQLGNIEQLVLFVSGAAFLAVIVIISNAMALIIRDRFREIAVARVLGFGHRDIITLIFGECLAIAIAGGSFGLLASIPLIRILKVLLRDFVIVDVVMPVEVIVISTALMIALGVIAGLLPAYQAIRANLAKTLTEA